MGGLEQFFNYETVDVDFEICFPEHLVGVHVFATSLILSKVQTVFFGEGGYFDHLPWRQLPELFHDNFARIVCGSQKVAC